MNALHRIPMALGAGLAAAAMLLAGCAGMLTSRTVHVTLSGAEQVPVVATGAFGDGRIIVGEDRSVSGIVKVAGLAPVAAHIHTGARGQNGPVAIGLAKSSDTTWEVPPGAKFTEAQYQEFLAGNTYVNFHTAANKGGEIRGQLKP